jgi:mitogen-activated protein kinase kinase kinase YODA
MFKIGNSSELPTIPDHLSEEGKDFVRLCLQRDPLDRPSAGQLLQHPFVKSASLERLILNADSSESPSAIINAMRSLVNVLPTCVFNSFIYSIILCTAALFF